ncbi:MAG TPA: hypothetical protein VJU61_26425, partial [Polyangiaceae bacterium]|nr:hypothetical protein [Polyangiaceae bacterium]
YLAYTQDLRHGDEDEAIFLHDLETGQTQLVEPDPAIQWRPRISQGQLLWLDDRHGHHTDQWGLEHRYDVMAVALPYVPGTLRRLTQAQPGSMRVLAFEGGRVLMQTMPGYEAPPPQDLQTLRLVEVARGLDTALPLPLALGDVGLDLSATHMLVRREPLGRCHLDVVELASGRSTELDLQGECPGSAMIDGDYVAWTRTLGTTTDVFWMDIGDLDAMR